MKNENESDISLVRIRKQLHWYNFKCNLHMVY